MKLEDVKAAIARAGAASSGPWFATNAEDEGRLCRSGEHDNHGYRFTVSSDPALAGWNHDSGYYGYGICEHDALFIAHARTDVPAMGARILELEAEISTLKRQVANGRDPIVRVVKDGEVDGVEMLETREMVGLPAEDFDLLLAAVRALLSHEQEARSMTMAVQTGRVPVDDERVQRIGRGTMECFDRLRSIAAEYPRPALAVTGAPNATVSNAEPQYHDHLLRRRNAPFSSDAGEGHSFHAVAAADGSWIKCGFAEPGATSMTALEMTIDKAELARAALGGAINEAKKRRG